MSPSYQVVKEGEVWVLRLLKENGKVQLYRCATEAQARALALLLLQKEVAAVELTGPTG